MSTLASDALTMSGAALDPSAPVLTTDSGDSPPVRTPHSRLTRREREVLLLLGQRLTDREIGERLFIGPRTVQGHVSRLRDKLDVRNGREAAAIVVHLGLV